MTIVELALLGAGLLTAYVAGFLHGAAHVRLKQIAEQTAQLAEKVEDWAP